MSILRVLFLERGEQRLDLLVVGDVALEAAGAGKIVDQVFGLGLHALVLVADGQGGAGLVEFLGDAPGDGALVGQPEDHGRLARQVDHAVRVPPGSKLKGETTTDHSQDTRAIFAPERRGRRDVTRRATVTRPDRSTPHVPRAGRESASRAARTSPRNRWRNNESRSGCGVGKFTHPIGARRADSDRMGHPKRPLKSSTAACAAASAESITFAPGRTAPSKSGRSSG